MRDRWVRCGFLVLLLGSAVVFWPAKPGFSQERGSEEAVWGTYSFGKAHAAMKTMRTQLKAILDAFLIGDEAEIVRNAKEIAENLTEASTELPVIPQDKEEVSKMFRGVIERAQMMRASAEQGKYEEAYRQYAGMTMQCIRCHQEWRNWGKLPSAGGPTQKDSSDRGPSTR